ncbi:MAG: hypothetical protein EXR75_08695 [Myxococcales bacterium]|nr:hypothetical protein [Myxococcales bacterium]
MALAAVVASSLATAAHATEPAVGASPSVSQPAARAQAKSAPGMRLGLDVNIEGGAGSLTSYGELLGLARIRVGMLATIESTNPQESLIFVAVSPVFQLSAISPATVGIETEFTHIGSGFWAQAAALVDVAEVEPGWAASVGWSIFGVQLERHVVHDGSGPHAVTALFGKLRAPLGIAWHAFR